MTTANSAETTEWAKSTRNSEKDLTTTLPRTAVLKDVEEDVVINIAGYPTETPEDGTNDEKDEKRTRKGRNLGLAHTFEYGAMRSRLTTC